MASLSRSTATALRAAASRPIIASSRAAPSLIRHESQIRDSANTSLTDASATSRELEGESQGRHTPDWRAQTDYRNSTFSPVPMRAMDGSEPGDTTPAAVLSGAPVELQARTVRIYKPAKPATQSGNWGSHAWRMDWDVLSKGHRWENPLMGWQSSADFMQGTHMNFQSKEDAIRFAQKQGYEFFVQEPNERKFTPKQYATQFLHSPKKLKQVRTK